MKRLLSHIPGLDRQRGQVMVIFALMLPVFIGMLGLGIDAAHLFQSRRAIQSAADLAALAGASQLPGDPAAARAAALDIAAQNGFSTGVTVNVPFEGDPNKIEVRITDEVGTYFMPALGLSSVDVSARTVASHEVAGYGSIVAKKDYHCWEGTVTIAGSNITINGTVHSNGGLDLRNSSGNTITGKLTYKSGPQAYRLDRKVDCGDELFPMPNPTVNNPGITIQASTWQDWPVIFRRGDFSCTHNLDSVNGDITRDGPWWEGGRMTHSRTLKPGVLCRTGSPSSDRTLSLVADNIKGTVTLVAPNVYIKGQNLNLKAHQHNVLIFADGKDRFYPGYSRSNIQLEPTGGRFEGLIVNRTQPSGPADYIEGGQTHIIGRSGFHQVGNIVGWAVRLAGSNWTLSGTDMFVYEPMRIVE